MIFTWNDISELNEKIVEKNLNYKVHLSDACSGQSMWIEDLGSENNFSDIEELRQFIQAYFSEMDVEIKFSWDKKSFWAKDRK